MCIDKRKMRFIYLILVLRKGDQADLKYSVKSFNLSMRCWLFMTFKERYNLYMNCALLDHVS